MKATAKRFTCSEIVVYRMSNTTKIVSFDTIEEAAEHVKKQRDLHPRSKKFNAQISDTVDRKSYNGLHI